MKDILTQIVENKRIIVENDKKALPIRELVLQTEKILKKSSVGRSMRASLESSPYGIIAEFKRKSPSKGWIHPDAKPEEVVPLYAANGASAISILTDEEYFGGSLDFIKRVRESIETPILRKEFIIDEYQLFQAKVAGADAVLLIASCLSKTECASLIATAHSIGLEVLLEMHGTAELDYASLDADMIGINNRNLGTFHTDIKNSFDVAKLLPSEKVKVSESGIGSPETIRELRSAGFRGFLIGETFMKESNPGEALKNFINNI